jgi:hypothetical protein
MLGQRKSYSRKVMQIDVVRWMSSCVDVCLGSNSPRQQGEEKTRPISDKDGARATSVADSRPAI